jgi:hypothetical protein
MKVAVADKRETDYRVAIEKCSAFPEDIKSDCVNAANARFGRS